MTSRNKRDLIIPAYFVARFNIKDAAALAACSQEAAPIIASFGGSLLFKGGPDQVLTETDPLSHMAVFSFPDATKLDVNQEPIWCFPLIRKLTRARPNSIGLIIIIIIVSKFSDRGK
jgi:uncharacterized protein (DUF1330 family)